MTTPTAAAPTAAAPTAAAPTSAASSPRRRRIAALAVLAAAGIGALTACGTDHPLAPVAQRPVEVSRVAVAAGEAGTASGTAAPGPAPSGNASGRGMAPTRTGGGSQGGGSQGGHSGGGQSAPPAIASFRVVRQPVCAVHGTPDAPFSTPGSGVTIAWSVTGADGAALAVDDPTTYGAYGTSYPAKGQQEFPFTCTSGTTTSHTFTVWPAGAKGTSTTLTVSAHSDG